MHSTNDSRWHTRFEEESLEDLADLIDGDQFVKDLVAQGYGPLDIADAFRRGGWSMQRLIHAIREAGFDALDFRRTVRHFKAECPHESGGHVGALPEVPRVQAHLHGGDDDVRGVARHTWEAIQVANDPVQFFDYRGISSWVKVGPLTP